MPSPIDPQKVMDLFAHRRDVFAQQQPNGAYYPVKRELTVDDVAEHLAGFSSYGTYVVRPEGLPAHMPDLNSVRYICWDLDVQDERARDWMANLIQTAVFHLVDPGEDYTSDWKTSQLLMEFSGNKGYHFWLFFSEPVPAYQARAFAENEVMRHWRDAAEPMGWPLDVEVFPKQDTVDEGGYGNLVKLPFGIHAVSGNRSEVVGYQGWAKSVDEVVPLESSLLPEATPPVPATRGAERGSSRPGSSGPASPFPCIDEIARNGVGRGHRDNAMFHLALYYYGHGIDQDVAEQLCLRANENFDPPMREAEVKHKVSSAYRGRYESARCGAGWLADVCPGPCRSGWSVAKSEATGGSLARAEPGTTVEVNVIDVDRARHVVRVGHPDAVNTPALRIK